MSKRELVNDHVVVKLPATTRKSVKVAGATQPGKACALNRLSEWLANRGFGPAPVSWTGEDLGS